VKIPSLKLLSLLGALALSSDAYSEESDIYGYLQLSAAASTDTHISAAFSRPCIWRDCVTSRDTNTHIIHLNGSPGWTNNSLVPSGSQTDTFYVKFQSGALNGMYFTIIGNDASSVTIDNAGIDISQLTNGDTLEIAPYWTLGTLYPASEAGTKFIASTSSLVRQTQLLLYNASATGINRAPSYSYYFYNGSWRLVGAPVTTSFDNTIIYPDTYFIQRNTSLATTPLFIGRVNTAYIATILEAASTTQNDNYIALSYPLDVTLNRSGLASKGFSASPSPLAITDRLYTFDPNATGYNNAANATYYYYNSAWRKVGANATFDFGDSVSLPAGGGFFIRKASGANSVIWPFDTQL